VRLALGRTAAQDALDVGAEADVEHPVGLVEHDVADVIQRQGAARQVVEHTAGRADDDGRPAPDLDELLVEALTTIDGHGAAVGAGREPGSLFGDLHDQLTGRRQDQRLGTGLIVVAPLIHEGQEEGGGLPGAGLGLSNDIASAEGFRDERRLDRGGFEVARAVERRQQLGAKGKRVETARGLHGRCGRQTRLQINESNRTKRVVLNILLSSLNPFRRPVQ